MHVHTYICIYIYMYMSVYGSIHIYMSVVTVSECRCKKYNLPGRCQRAICLELEQSLSNQKQPAGKNTLPISANLRQFAMVKLPFGRTPTSP